ncbi:hypothetical protein HID58_048199 [Brassica napus]|uniref:Uncharacterized protein n=1 Tax=Brassica napus TaxID=3708 RepID=A0ABQ8B1H3_BRANA|nr:hypothetical protein HID58_048199 [Brassica napus]
MLLGLLTGLLTCDLRRLQSSLPYNQNADLLTVLFFWANTPLRGNKKTIKVLNMIKLHGKPICVNKASQDKKIIDVGANLWKQLKRWFIFTLLPKDAH